MDAFSMIYTSYMAAVWNFYPPQCFSTPAGVASTLAVAEIPFLMV